MAGALGHFGGGDRLARSLLLVNGMGRPLRMIPNRAVVEVVTRTHQSRPLVKPGPELNELIMGVLGRALSMYDVTLHAFVTTPTCMKLLVSPGNAEELAKWMNHVNSNVAREIKRLTGWEDQFWARRYSATPLKDAETARARLRDMMMHVCTETGVTHPCEWNGAASIRAMTYGTSLRGTWIDRKAENAALRRRAKRLKPRKPFDRTRYRTSYSVPLTPIPGLNLSSLDEYRQLCIELAATAQRRCA